MAEDFTPIETQEAFDEAIKERIDRAKNSVREEFKDYEAFKTKAENYDTKESEYKTSLSEKDKRIADLEAQVNQFKNSQTKAALTAEYHLDPSLAEFLTGETETDWRAAAEKLVAVTQRPDPEKTYTETTETPTLAKVMLDRIEDQIRKD